MSMYMSRFGVRPEPKSRPIKVEPFVAPGATGKSDQSDFLRNLQEQQSQSSSSKAGQPGFYDPKDDVWLHGVNFEAPAKEEQAEDKEKKKEQATPKVEAFRKTDIPPLAYDPYTLSGDEEEVADEDEWTFPRAPDQLVYENYPRIGPGIIGKVGTIKLLVQPGFVMKPMIEEAVIPKPGVFKSTYSCYLRKVTSYIVAWTGCISHRTLRSYRRKGDADWIRLYNYCLQQTGLGQSHLFLETRAIAALCDELEDPEAVRAELKPVTSSAFLNQAATSSTSSHAASGSIRVTTTGLFTDFNIIRKSNKRNTQGIQSVLDHHFYWTSLHHFAAEDRDLSHLSRCIHAVTKATEFANSLLHADEATQIGASIHIWISFAEYVTWNNQGASATFSFNGFHEEAFISALRNLVRESPVPVFVSFCTASEFHHGGEMQMERTVEKMAVELSRSGVATSTNRLMWVECSNFTDAKFHAVNPKTTNPIVDADDQWNRNAAFACLDKALFREKMLYACVVGDSTITDMEKALGSRTMAEVLSEPPPELQFVSPAKNCERIPIDKLRKMKTTSPLLNADFNAVDPKVVHRDDRFWYVVPPRPLGQEVQYYQENSDSMVMCTLCSKDKFVGNSYDANEIYAATCPNCAANLCRAFYFMKKDPKEADVALRWAAATILQEQKDNPAWGLIQPADNIREWMWKTIVTFRAHPSGVGKFVSHFGTTRMLFKNAANIMFSGQGKRITVDRQQQFDDSGTVRDYFQFSYDHGNRMYADYMRLMFPAEDLKELINSLDPKEEALGACVEICLGILRTALMYEGCGTPTFRWRDVNGVLTGLETSLMVFNATAYASGVDNRKMKSGRSKGGSFGFESFRSIPNDIVPERRCPVMPTKDHRISVDAAMPDASQTPAPTEGKVVDPVTPSTEAGKGSYVSAPGNDPSKRRRVDQQLQARDQMDNVLDGIQKMLENNEVCRNCLSPEHETTNCPRPEANEWDNLLLKVRDGLSERKANVKVEGSEHHRQETPRPGMKTDNMSEKRNQEFLRQQRDRNPQITFYHNTISLKDVVGKQEMLSFNVGGRRPEDLGFRDKGEFQQLIDRHMVESNFIPQVGYESEVSNRLMPKFSRWKETLKYGRIVPVPVNCEGFADPDFHGCGALPREFSENYNHNAIGEYTRRWNRVLRHDIGRGAAPKCDELGWVDIESFLVNDFSWPRGDDPAIYEVGRIDMSVVRYRRRKLMEGYRHSMSPKARKKRTLIVAIYITPDELSEMLKYEDRNIYNEHLLKQYRGWVRPIALRATSGHSFHAANKRPLMVNIDFKNLNMPFTKEIAAQVGGGYHVTSVKNLLSIVKHGLMPGGNAGNRDHVFFGEYAPWDPINTCTLSWIPGELFILVLYIPGTRLLKYRSGFTYNGDIVVGETVPFSEVQEAWIARKSDFGGDVASGPRRIMSSKVTEEVVCQCDDADRGVPPQLIKGKLDRLITRAQELGKVELVDELKERWVECSNDLSNGYIGAELGAAISLAAHELYPNNRGISRVCPNCMIDLPTSLLYCPQCKGDFVSSGLTTRPQPVVVDLTREQIEEIVREKERELGPDDIEEEEDAKVGDDATDDPMGQPSADYSPDENKDKDGDATMESTSNQWDDRGDVAIVVEDDREEGAMDSLQVNYDRYPIDLPRINRPAYCTDVEMKACRYLLFKLAKFSTDHFSPWKKHVLDKTDRQKRETDTGGLRHDITGKGHPMEMQTVIVDGVERQEPIYKDGLYITVSDETALEHYRREQEANRTEHPPEENLRRYRFSVVVNRLTETLYRLGYDLDKEGDFGAQVKICNSVGEPTGDGVTTDASVIMRAYGAVEHAMREAITHTFDAPSFSFFSEAQTLGHYKFNIQELQSYILLKNKGRANKELMHLMHYHGVENVPLFQRNMEKVYTRDANIPQVMKFLSDTPLAQRRGFNMLMPVRADGASIGNTADNVDMDLPEEITVLEGAANDESKPDPPDSPLIEDYDEEEEESTNVAGEDDPMISVDEKKGRIGRVATGPVGREHQPPEPVVLEPALPERRPAVILKAKTKTAAKPQPKPDPQPRQDVQPKPDVRDAQEKPKPTTSHLTVAPKTRPSQSAPSSGARRADSTLPSSSDWASHTPEDTNARSSQDDIARIDLTDQTSGASGDLWRAYTGNLTDVRDRPAAVDPQLPATASPKGSGGKSWGRRRQQSSSTWRPKMRDEPREEEVAAEIPPWRANQQRQAPRFARPRVRWEPTGIYGNREHQWNELWRRYPEAETEDDFWYEPSSGEWFVREYF